MDEPRNHDGAPACPPEEKPKRESPLLTLAKFVLAGLLIYFLVRRGDIDLQQLRTALTAHWALGLAAMAVMGFSGMVQAYRWDVILRDRQVRVSYWQALRYLMIGKFFSLVVPGYLSEDIVRALYLIRLNAASRSRVLMSLMADRTMGIMTLFLVVASSLMVRTLGAAHADARLISLRTFTALALAAFVAFLLVVRRFPQPPSLLRSVAAPLRLARLLDAAYAELHYYCCAPLLQMRLLLVSLLNYALLILSFALLGRSLGMSASWSDYSIFVPLGSLVTMIPIAPIGLGVGQVAFLALFKMAGSNEGANLFSLSLAFGIPLNLLGGLFYLGVGRERPARMMSTSVANDSAAPR